MSIALSAPPVAQEAPPNLVLLLMVVFGVVILLGFVMVLATRYKRCPSNKILVIYGKTAQGRSAKTLHGGGAFVWPLIQAYAYLDLEPMQIEIPLQGALSIENIRVAVPSVFTVAIGTDMEGMQNAAVRLLSLEQKDIVQQAEDIIFGQLRQVIASLAIQDINRDRDLFLDKIQNSLEPELKKIGLVLINVNIKDITDESGYIVAIGRKAAATAVKQAEIDVADQNRKGAIGVAEADREQQIHVAGAEKIRDIGIKEAEKERAVRVADLDKEKVVGEKSAQFEQESLVRDKEREMRVNVADANAKAVVGENEAKAEIASTNAELKVKEANAYQLGETRRREAEAAVLEAQYVAQAKAATAEGHKIEAERRAELEASARAEKAKTVVDAEATAARNRIEAEGEAAAIYSRLEAEARGQYEILAKKGEGLKKIVESCGGAQEAFRMLMLEHMDHLSETAAKAIANVKFDKVIVWDSGTSGSDGRGGNGGAAGFLRGLAGALPPMMQIMRDVGGVDMPEYFGKLVDDSGKPGDTGPAEEAKPKARAATKGGDSEPESNGGEAGS
ncbi:MAG: SPFH domain-containing protein [Planctomycetota bacterium]|nr:SPFH domain-containing protein [Planctomycetota bacterium]